MLVAGDRTALLSRLADTRLFVLDLDGTTYVENSLVPGALEFLARVGASGRRYVFLTNNSSRSTADYVKKLAALHIPATSDNVFTSGQATALFLTAAGAHPRVFLVGTRSLEEEFKEHGIRLVGREDDGAEYVVVGFDTELEYWKLRKACGLIDRGVTYIATHPDMVCPIEGGRYIPDCGAMCQMIRHATGREPSRVFGKPDPSIINEFCRKVGIDKKHVMMIGDRLYTDIALGLSAGVTTLCVLSGETSAQALAGASHKPHFVVDSIADLTELL